MLIIVNLLMPGNILGNLLGNLLVTINFICDQFFAYILNLNSRKKNDQELN